MPIEQQIQNYEQSVPQNLNNNNSNVARILHFNKI